MAIASVDEGEGGDDYRVQAASHFGLVSVHGAPQSKCEEVDNLHRTEETEPHEQA